MTTINPTASLYAGGEQLRRMAASMIRRLCEMPEHDTVTEFADKHRILAGDKGPYQSAVVPYARRPQELMANPSIEMLALCWGVQLTKSTSIENALHYRICRMPSRMLVVHPKIDFAELWAKDTFREMVRSSRLLRSRIRLDRGSDATLRYYRYPGGSLFVASAESETELSGRAAEFLFLDEVDRMRPIPGGGSPVEIAMRRQAGADIGLAVLTSTPGDADKTIIWPYLEAGSFELFCVPCPHCELMQPLIWSNLRWDGENRGTAHYVCPGPQQTRKFLEQFDRLEKERRVAHLAAEAAPDRTTFEAEVVDDSWRAPTLLRDRFAAGGCGGVIEESYKPRMMDAGMWHQTNPDSTYPSSHLNSLYSPFRKSSWAVLAEEWHRSHAKPADLQVFINTRLAELYDPKGEAQDPNTLQSRREHELLEGVVPRGAGAVTIGFDVQENRIEGYAWAWGAGLESWPIASIIIPGDPQKEHDDAASIWGKVDEFRRKLFPHQDSSGIGFITAAAVFIDSGFATTQVYKYTKSRKSERVYACKGVGGPVSLVGKPTLQGAENAVVYPVGTDEAKNEFLRSQIAERNKGPGFVHVPGWFTDQQCKQLVAEQRKRRMERGRIVTKWELKKGEERNEALDCRNYARAALESLGTKAMGMLAAAADDFTEQAQQHATGGQTVAAAAARPAKQRMLSRGIRSDH